MTRPPPRSTLFPYTPLFRSRSSHKKTRYPDGQDEPLGNNRGRTSRPPFGDARATSANASSLTGRHARYESLPVLEGKKGRAPFFGLLHSRSLACPRLKVSSPAYTTGEPRRAVLARSRSRGLFPRSNLTPDGENKKERRDYEPCWCGFALLALRNCVCECWMHRKGCCHKSSAS